MIPDSDFKIFGVLSVVLIWAGLLFTIFKWRGNKSMSFSLHAAQTRAGQVYYFFLFLATLPLFYLFIVKWYVPTFDLGLLFIILATVATIGQFVAASIPAVPGHRNTIHEIGAYTMGALFIPMLFMVAFADVSLFAKIIACGALAYMIGSIVLLFAWKGSKRYYLYFQAMYIAAFHTAILASVYL